MHAGLAAQTAERTCSNVIVSNHVGQLGERSNPPAWKAGMRREAHRWFESGTARQLHHHHVQLQCLRCARNLRKSSSQDKDATLPRS